MYFTLAVSAANRTRCAELTGRAQSVDPAVLPVPGPAVLAWQSADGTAALLHWGTAGDAGTVPEGGSGSPAGTASRGRTIWAAPDGGGGVCARTSVTRVDPVYLAEVPGAVIVADRSTWAAWAASRLDDHDPLHVCALLNPGFPLGAATAFRGVSALPPAAALRLIAGRRERLADTAAPPGEASSGAVSPAGRPGAVRGRAAGGGLAAGAVSVAEALVAAVAPLRDAGGAVELSLTGGKDSRLIAAALVAAKVPVIARTHGFPDHPDVVVAAEVARVLGIEHKARTPAAPDNQMDVVSRIRGTVLVADGMLSAFENVGRPDPSALPRLTIGGHGGELLRGGYAETAAGRPPAGGARALLAPAKRAARSAELLRRLTTRHLGLVRPAPGAAYVASLAPWGARLSRHPLRALDDFYLVNRAGRWSAAARQAYLLREDLTQPLFDDRVVLAARAVPLADRVSGALTSAVLAELAPPLADVALAGKPSAAAGPPPFDWRRQYGDTVATFLRGYILDQGTLGGLFDVVSLDAAEKLLTPPHPDRGSVWALATLACLLSGDYRRAREPAPRLPVG